MALHTIHLFAGAGGGILGDLLLGHIPIAACEIERYPREVLLQRQRDGVLPQFPVWDDVKTLRADNPECAQAFTIWRGIKDNLAICGGFPCQDISSAGKGAGIEGERSGLWKEFARIIREVGPRFVFVENSPLLTKRGIHVVLGDLASVGYDAKWGVLGAHHASAPHKRDRIWILGSNSNLQSRGAQQKRKYEWPQKSIGGGERWMGSSICNASITRFSNRPSEPMGEPRKDTESERSDWWATEPNVGRVAHGVASRVDRLKAIGNGQVPAVVKLAWETLISEFI